jgi:hypothetical protein
VCEKTLVASSSGIGYHDDGLVVLGSRAEHRRAADVDLLDRVLELDVGPADRLLERVEVHGDEIDRDEPAAGQLPHVLRLVPAREQGGMDSGVQRLDATVHDLGESGHRLDGDHGHVGLAEHVCRSTRRDDLPSERRQALGELGDAPLVRYRDQRSRHPILLSQTV